MMKKALILVFGFIAVVACNESIVEKPENLIPKETMTDIYYDIAILNGVKSTAANKLEEIELDPEEFLYQKYNIDSTQLSKSSIYYTSKPALQLEMFTEVETRLQKLKDSVDSRLKKKQKTNVKKVSKPKKATNTDTKKK